MILECKYLQSLTNARLDHILLNFDLVHFNALSTVCNCAFIHFIAHVSLLVTVLQYQSHVTFQ